MKNSIKVVEALLREDDPDAKLKSTARNPFPSGYKPELDVTSELNDHLTSRYLQLMGILCWATSKDIVTSKPHHHYTT